MQMSRPNTRIVIVDDHTLFRESLTRFLDAVPDFEVLGQYSTVADAVQGLAASQADVVLLDYDLGVQSGAALLSQIPERSASAKVLMVTAGIPDGVTPQVLESGASGIFLKHGSPDRLTEAIRQVLRGEVWLDQSMLQTLVARRTMQSEHLERRRPLTQRQGKILRGILDGLANKEIAWKLEISESAVKAAIQELFQKAGVRTRAQLVRIALEKHAHDWLGPAL